MMDNRSRLSSVVGCELKLLKSNQQTNNDYCGASGASRVLEIG